MGGGDLNLKKSWHPHTMKNQERVWKAEQASEQEERKLRDLRKEIEHERNREELRAVGENSGVLAESKNNKQIEWMYKNSAELINRDEYLLGRTIDKSFERLQAEENRKEQEKLGYKQPINHVEHECVPFSMRSHRDMQNNEQVDTQRKTLEDPLMQIKKLEMEKRRKLLDNPVKLKKLQDLIITKRLNERNKRKKSKKLKKYKKNKKNRSHSRTESDTDSATDSCSDSIDEKDLSLKLNKLMLKLKKSKKITNMKEFINNVKDSSKSKKSKRKRSHSKISKRPKSYRTHSRDSSSESKTSEHSTPVKLQSNHFRSENHVSNIKQRYTKNRSISPSYSRNQEYKHVSQNRNRTRSRSRTREQVHRNPFADKRQLETRTNSRRSPQNYQESRAVRNPFANHTRDKLEYGRRSNTRSPSKEKRRTKNPFADNGSRNSKQNSTGRSPSYTRARYSPTKAGSRNSSSITYRQSQQVRRTRSRSRTDQHIQRPRSHSRRQRSRSRSDSNSRKPKNKYADDKAARLREMMENAEWRENDRMRAVTKHRNEYAREEEQQKTKDFDKNFINKQVQHALSNQTSVGSRIRSNLNNIQRSSAAMNTNFARK